PEATGRLARINSGVYDALLGKTYSEIGSEARSMHKCQGMGQLLALPTPTSQAPYQLVETTMPGQMQKDEASLFDGIDSRVIGLAAFAGAQPPNALTDGLTAIASAVQSAQKMYDASNDTATLAPLLQGLAAVRALRRDLRSMTI